MPHKQHQEEKPLQSECVKIIVLELNEEELRKREEAKIRFEKSIQRFYESAQGEYYTFFKYTNYVHFKTKNNCLF